MKNKKSSIFDCSGNYQPMAIWTKNELARTLAKISKTVRPVRPQVLKVPG